MRFKIILILILIGGGLWYWANVSATEPKIDPNLVHLVNEWKSEMESNGIEYKAGFNRIDYIKITKDPDRAAHYDLYSRTITLSIHQLERGRLSAKAALWHELGHFVFGLDHSTGIMNDHSLSEEFYEKNWSKLKKEYLKTCKDHEWKARI